MRKLIIAIIALTSCYFSSAKAEVFSDLVENKVYYAKYFTLFEDEKGVLWTEDTFSQQKDQGWYGTDHTVAVKKIDGKLFHLEIPKTVKIQRGKLNKNRFTNYGPGCEKFLSTMIQFANPLLDENRMYSAATLPEGKSGWLLTWELFKVGEGEYRVKKDAPLEAVHYYVNHGLFVKKVNGQLLVDKSTFDKEKAENKLDSVNPDKIFVGSVLTSRSSYIDILAMEGRGAHLGEPCNDLIEAEISEGLLEEETQGFPFDIRFPEVRNLRGC